MNGFYEITAENFNLQPFQLIGKEWMLIASGEDRVNAMTASWGGIGVLWGKNVAFIFVRKSRFTKELIDRNNTFSLNFLAHEKNAKLYGYMGSASGRNENKVEKSGLTVEREDGIPYFAEAETVIVCKNLCRQPIESKNFLDESIDKKWYADSDYHDMYIGEITKILQK